ncbi:MAG: ABC transporter permease, partial [Geminicoccales bacterium]
MAVEDVGAGRRARRRRATRSGDASRVAGLDLTLLLLVPGALVVLALFFYPFLHGLGLSFEPLEGDALANYRQFFTTPRLYDTIATTLWLAVPATLINVGFAVPIAFAVRHLRHQRVLTAILVVPITLGTVLIAEGLLGYLGPQGWLNRVLTGIGLVDAPLQLTHNYWGVLLSLIVSEFPFAFLLTLSYLTGIDPALPQAAATLGAGPTAQFRHIYLPLLAPGLAITF